jgi:hypothetical protein
LSVAACPEYGIGIGLDAWSSAVRRGFKRRDAGKPDSFRKGLGRTVTIQRISFLLPYPLLFN